MSAEAKLEALQRRGQRQGVPNAERQRIEMDLINQVCTCFLSCSQCSRTPVMHVITDGPAFRLKKALTCQEPLDVASTCATAEMCHR